MLTQSSTAEVFYDKIRKELRVTSVHQCSNLRSLGRIIGAVTVAFLEEAAKYDDGADENEVQSSDHVSVNVLDKSKVWSGIPTSLSLFPMPVSSHNDVTTGGASDVGESSVCTKEPDSLKFEGFSRRVDYQDIASEVGTSKTSCETANEEGQNNISDIENTSDSSFVDKNEDFKSVSKEKKSSPSDWSQDLCVESTRMEDDTLDVVVEPLRTDIENCSPDSSVAKNAELKSASSKCLQNSESLRYNQILTVPKYASGKTARSDETKPGSNLPEQEKLPLNLTKNKCILSEISEVEVKKEIVDDWFNTESDGQEAVTRSSHSAQTFSRGMFQKHSVRHKSGCYTGLDQSFDDIKPHSVSESHLPLLQSCSSHRYGEVAFPPVPQHYSKPRTGIPDSSAFHSLSYMSSPRQHYLKSHGGFSRLPVASRYPRLTCQLNSNRVRRGHLQSVTCAVCGAEIKDKSGFSTHVSLHCLEDRQNCPICLKPFSNRANLLRHSSLHFLVRLYQCPVCYRRIKRGDNFLVHMRNQHPEHADISGSSADPGGIPILNIKSIKKEVDDLSVPYRTLLPSSESDPSSKAGRRQEIYSGDSEIISEVKEFSTETHHCSFCLFKFRSLVLLEKHMAENHAFQTFDGKR